ncbi:MAG TPA: RNA polymerase sigma factor [Phycisphaerae bacterium]|nr:RNA polymerase sigma factor [Phycisphaerae bacterium]
MTDAELLDLFVQNRSEDAFRALLERHLALVYFAALRQVRDPGTAQDIAQAVFIILAHKSADVRKKGTPLPAWLLVVTRYASANALQRLKVRVRHEREAAAMKTQSASTIDSENLSSIIDKALNQLSVPDRTAIAVYYLENRSLREVGSALAISETAAHMRISRALQRLRTILTRLEITCPADALEASLHEYGAVAVPPMLLAAIFSGLPGHSAISGTGSLIAQQVIKKMLLVKVKTFVLSTLVAAAVVATGVPLVYHAFAGGPSPTVTVFTSASVSAPPTSRIAGGMPNNIAPFGAPAILTQQQWNDIFNNYAKQIVSLQMKIAFRSRDYTSNEQAQNENTILTKQHQTTKITTGYNVVNNFIQLHWVIASGLLYAERIQVGGINVASKAKSNGDWAPAVPIYHTTYVVGPNTVWYLMLMGGGVANVEIYKREGEASLQPYWQIEVGACGLNNLSRVWMPFNGFISDGLPANFHRSQGYHLIDQSYDRSTGLIKLTYVQLHQYLPQSRVGRMEFVYELKLDGGLRIYRESLQSVGGPDGPLSFEGGDYGGFEKSNGIWFPTSIHQWWSQDGKLIFMDNSLTINDLIVNGKLPPNTFSFTPPTGSHVHDSRTDTPINYIAGSKNPSNQP